MITGYIIACFLVGISCFALTSMAWLSMVVLAALLLPMVWPHKSSRVALISIFATLLFVQVWIASDMGGATWLAFSATWISLATFLFKKCDKDMFVTVCFCILSALTYFFGRTSGAEFSATSTGFPYLLAANIFAIIAILYAGWRGGISLQHMGTTGRIFGMVDDTFLSPRNSVAYLSGIKKEAPEVKEGL